ncbi:MULTISPECIES: RepB family plasmid replication initiator protein, partial [unclassified Lactococcus]|uniref:RepB family plasmid replication initiator protein n=1 Tax=unclassified Lactococcus TaxID=2643510 RepID=UPI0011C7938E
MTASKKNESTNKIPELRERKVVEANDLITSIAKMDKTPMKIFELAVSCIDTEKPPKDNVVYLSKQELFSFFDVYDNDKHSRFKKSIEKMQEQAFFEVRQEVDKGFNFRRIVPIPEVAWNDYNDEVYIRFDQAIMPYLIDLKSNFTQYALTDVMGLESKYSIIIYKWLSMSYNQFEHYKFKNSRTKKQLHELKNPKIEIVDIRTLTDTLDIYKDMSNFERRVLKNSLTEINLNTHFNVTYDKIKKGRSVSEIQFHIEKKVNWKDEEYKKNDTKSQLSIENKKKEQNDLLAKAISNPYTMQLITAGLLFATDMAKQKTLIGLSEHVYPL